MSNVGDRIVELRKALGIRQLDLCRELNIPQATLSQYESEKREISPEALVKIAKFFDVSIEYLLGLTNFKKGTHFLDESFITIGNRALKRSELYDLIDKLNPGDRGAVHHMIKALLQPK